MCCAPASRRTRTKPKLTQTPTMPRAGSASAKSPRNGRTASGPRSSRGVSLTQPSTGEEPPPRERAPGEGERVGEEVHEPEEAESTDARPGHRRDEDQSDR